MSTTPDEIAALLFREWDPIGVNHIAPTDEYADYAAALAAMLARGASVDAMCAYLSEMRATQMMLGPDLQSDRRVAGLIAALR